MKVVGIAEARRRLPELVRAVADGNGPIYVGRYGRPEVALTIPALARTAVVRRDLVGLVELVSPDALQEGRREIRAQVAAGLERKAARITGGAEDRKRRRR